MLLLACIRQRAYPSRPCIPTYMWIRSGMSLKGGQQADVMYMESGILDSTWPMAARASMTRTNLDCKADAQ